MSAGTEPSQVLEFDLGDDRFCVGIEYVSQIVEREDVRDLPNTPGHVEGVTELRGETTTIVDPKRVFDVDGGGEADHIIVFDAETVGDDASVGWQIDSVQRVVEVAPEDVDESAMADQSGIRGLINRGDEFVVWLTPRSETIT